MSNIIETPKVEATLSAGARKVFSSFPCADMARGLIYRDGTSDETSVVPSDVRMTSAAAAAALGAKMSPQSFVAGLVFAAVRHAHGNQFPVENLPAGSKVAVAAACGTLPRGKGCNARMLINAAEVGIAALLALPAPAARSKAAMAAPTVSPTTSPTTSPTVSPTTSPTTDIYADGAVNADADSAIEESAANAAQDARIASEAKALADAAQAAEYRAAKASGFATDAKMAESAIVATICKRADAEAILRQLAQELGFSLRKATLRKAA